jgi:hypothetical protein
LRKYYRRGRAGTLSGNRKKWESKKVKEGGLLGGLLSGAPDHPANRPQGIMRR